jgi:hypothetical protein
MNQDDCRQQRCGLEWRRAPLGRALQRQREQWQEPPAQPRRHQAPPHAFLDPASRLARQGEGNKRTRQREPWIRKHPREEQVRADPGKEKGHPEQEPIRGREIEHAQ